MPGWDPRQRKPLSNIAVRVLARHRLFVVEPKPRRQLTSVHIFWVRVAAVEAQSHRFSPARREVVLIQHQFGFHMLPFHMLEGI